jgi:hypothetical protein
LILHELMVNVGSNLANDANCEELYEVAAQLYARLVLQCFLLLVFMAVIKSI